MVRKLCCPHGLTEIAETHYLQTSMLLPDRVISLAIKLICKLPTSLVVLVPEGRSTTLRVQVHHENGKARSFQALHITWTKPRAMEYYRFNTSMG